MDSGCFGRKKGKIQQSQSTTQSENSTGCERAAREQRVKHPYGVLELTQQLTSNQTRASEQEPAAAPTSAASQSTFCEHSNVECLYLLPELSGCCCDLCLTGGTLPLLTFLSLAFFSSVLLCSCCSHSNFLLLILEHVHHILLSLGSHFFLPLSIKHFEISSCFIPFFFSKRSRLHMKLN